MKFIIFPGNDDVFYKMFEEVNDAKKYPNINIYKNIYTKYDNSIIRLRNKLSYHLILGGIINVLFDTFVSKLLKINKIEKNIQEDTCLIFSNLTFRLLPDYIIRQLLRNKYVYIAVYLLDSSSQCLCIEAVKKCLKHKIKFTYTFDSKDATKYGFNHFYYIYSRLIKESEKIDTNVMFFGSDKGRLEHLVRISEEFKKQNISSKISIIGVKDKVEESRDIIINKPIPYIKMLEEIQKTKCILDFVIENQTGLSYRPMEAICYNKKLLTNNKSIFEFPYYNPQYMQYFSDISQIDMEFLKREETVDYGYNGDYSPLNFIKRIEMDIKETQEIDI